jgi:mannosyltransferase OCH1-like enzyme
MFFFPLYLNIYHNDWNDKVVLNDECTITRISDNKDTGKYIMNDNILLIDWDNWDKEYFLSENNIDYYQIILGNYFNLYISVITLVNHKRSGLFIINNNFKKIYKIHNLESYGTYEIIRDNLIINNKLYIYFNNKYYEENYFNELYEIVNTIDTEPNINNVYLLLKKNNSCFLNYNFNKTGKYKKYKNKINIVFDGVNNTYCKNIKEDNYYIIKENYTNELSIKDFLINNINTKESVLFINNNNKYLDQLFYTIEYFINLNSKCILFDNINNKDRNTLYIDYANYEKLNIIYYKNINEVENILNFSDIYNKIQIYTNSNEKIDISKINIKNIYINNIYNNDGIRYNLLDCDSTFSDNFKENIKKRWNELNYDKFKNILEFHFEKIPKIMHFIWVGPNQIEDVYVDYIKSWIIKHDDWKFCFWNDNNIPLLINQEYYDKTDVYAMKADILRYELLYFIGGVYVDCDFLCFKNIENIIESYDGFSAYESDTYISNALMGFKRYDNMLLNIIQKIPINIDINYNDFKNIPKLTGPIFLTELWNIYKSSDHYLFPKEYFYSYSTEDKINGNCYNISNNTYAVHTWGYSWNHHKKYNNIAKNYYLVNYYLSDLIIEHSLEKKKLKFNQLSTDLRNILYFTKNNNNEYRKKIVHIMGLFFTGGIERYLYYIDKYGDHSKYKYYLLYISNDKYVYNLQNIKMISFNWDHEDLNKILCILNPDLIIDHYSIYVNDNSVIYNNINRNIILSFVHSALCYKNDISKLDIRRCINLYYELDKQASWTKISENYYVTLGCEINNLKLNKNRSSLIKISIIGRIAEEKIPLNFLQKLCILSNSIKHRTQINIYGEKDKVFNNDYVLEFEKVVEKSSIIVNDFINPLEMDTIYKNTDILLIPSIYETGSFTCLEAFSYGIPVIARNVFGLKYLIKNNSTGYLCKDDDEIINKIKNFHDDAIINNYDIIRKESLKYNINDKIKDLEVIISKNLIENNIVIITSVLNCIDNPLSYYSTRSVFTMKERYGHTLKSIESIKKFIPNVDILFCECSDLEGNKNYEEIIRGKVEYYYNFYDNIKIRENVNGLLKGLGEASILLEALELLFKNKKNYKNIFKLSGRYYLNDKFNYEIFNNNNNIFTNWDNSNSSYCTIFYKICMNDIFLFKESLNNSISDLNKNSSIEQCIYKYFNKNIELYNKLEISGYLSTEGYFFSI